MKLSYTGSNKCITNTTKKCCLSTSLQMKLTVREHKSCLDVVLLLSLLFRQHRLWIDVVQLIHFMTMLMAAFVIFINFGSIFCILIIAL
jgi:hypothetical protein